jgi:osmotically-inducible protein OsmY
MHVISDDDLRTWIEEELAWELEGDDQAISVAVDHGAVTVRGTACRLRQKLAAIDAVRRVYGVGVVNDELQVELAPSDRRQDAELGAAVLQALTRAVLVPPSVASQARDGVVTLVGRAAYQFERDEAERVATNVTGVVRVVDEIVLHA